MKIQCPSCNSHRINTINLGRKVGGASMALAAGASGLTLTANTAKTVMMAASMSNPITAAGSLLLNGLVSAAAGGIAGAALGEMVDENILDNFECLSCGHIFSAKKED